MNVLKYSLILLIVVSKCFAQKEITLKTTTFNNQNLPIYIHKVIDARENKAVFIQKNNKQVNVTLAPLLPIAIKNFINTSFPKKRNAKPIFIKIKEFQIKEFQSSINHLTARVYVNLVFLEKHNNQFKQITQVKHYEDKKFELENNTHVFDTHETRIRAALEYCMQTFMYKYITINKLPYKNSLTYHKSDTYIAPEKNGQWYNILTYKKVFSKHKKGWNVAYTGFSDSNKDFIIPFVLSYDQFSSKIKDNKKYKSIDSYTLGTGFDGYLKINPGIYANLGLNIPLGVESIRYANNKKKNRFLIGLNLKQGIKIIPWKNYGFVVGANVFQQLQNSKTYTTDLGFEVEVGFSF
ncbi:hypothetical protein [Tenacibaculum soleae]|uniref:hypothetical protein n=1 Tax=Tenacibaculum soleae TaxID=447689 RepID=UPI0022FFDDF7|nr:hypothetical protein [Tenacibaculum soleae]